MNKRRKVVVNMSITLDGVMQAPGRVDEDTRGDFKHGGWAVRYFDPVMFDASKASLANPSLLFGRRTYQDFYAVWPNRTDNPFTEVLNKSEKYVASTTLKDPLPWINSVLLQGEAVANVASLKKRPGTDLVVLGSGELVRSLLRGNLVDELVLSIHPLVLGSGSRLFSNGSPPGAFKLVESKTTITGVVIATYSLAASSVENASPARWIGDSQAG